MHEHLLVFPALLAHTHTQMVTWLHHSTCKEDRGCHVVPPGEACHYLSKWKCSEQPCTARTHTSSQQAKEDNSVSTSIQVLHSYGRLWFPTPDSFFYQQGRWFLEIRLNWNVLMPMGGATFYMHLRLLSLKCSTELSISV